MASKKVKHRLVTLATIGAATAFAIGLSYSWITRETRQPTNESDKSISRCIIFDVATQCCVDWRQLEHLDIAVVVPPSINLEHAFAALKNIPKHKIIVCDTEEGVWSVVRHLRKDEVIIGGYELSKIPDDIYRYSVPKHNLSLS
ncbi:LAQU0S01e15962g1_1 [Lachancea quebecensis]|uniref:Peroxisome assembly protein 22 n=1 Tax=Lachancea quebecensis TaxID=1654605 RepID=A0A0N7MKZ4_9SACH|nr:LAQU0S01e15962g1_1 [Lachancea quebecensis]